MDQFALEQSGAFESWYQGFCSSAGAEHHLVVVDDDLYTKLTLDKMHLPFRVISIADDLLYFCIEFNVLMKVEMSGICVQIVAYLASSQESGPIV